MAPRRPAHAKPRPTRSTYLRRRIIAVLAAVTLVVVGYLGVTLVQALTNPSYGSSMAPRFAEWLRDHGGGSVANWVEHYYYSHHQPKKGGAPPKDAFGKGGHAGATAPSSVWHLAAPKAVVSPASPAQAGEGQWSPLGGTVKGAPGMYQTFVRPDAEHTSFIVGLVWMDPKLLKTTLYSGSYIPGGGPYAHTTPIPPTAAATMTAAFNAGFRMQDANGGYYTDGKVVLPLRKGAASVVIYKNGMATVGAWGRDAKMGPEVKAVRQNLDLIVDGGKPVAGLSATDNTRWGATLGGAVNVWRSGIGETADGALVYVGGPSLTITALADLFIRAHCTRAMELDINSDWVQFSTYAQPAAGANGKKLLDTMQPGSSTQDRYFQSWWARDFFTQSLRAKPLEKLSPTASVS